MSEGFSLDGDISLLKKAAEKNAASAAEKPPANDDAPEFTGESTPVIQPMQEEGKSAFEAVELPTGYLDDNGVLHSEIELREMTGDEEDILTSRKMPVHARMNRIMENCCLRVGEYTQNDPGFKNIIRGLTATDRLYLILQMRILTLGPLFSSKVRCPECEHLSLQTVNLNEFKITGMPGDKKVRIWEGVLPKSGMKYKAKIQTGWEEAKLQKFADSKDMMSLAMLGRLLMLGDKSPVTMNMVKRLGLKDRGYLRAEFKKREGEIENNLEFECMNCGAEVKEEVDIGSPNFFFPSETSEH